MTDRLGQFPLPSLRINGYLYDLSGVHREAARREAEGFVPEAARQAVAVAAGLTSAPPMSDAPPPPAPDDLVRGLRDRARHARAERNAIATRDAWHFEQAADAIEALRAERDAARKRYDDLADGFWRIVDGSKLDGLPSCELNALQRIVARAEAAEAERDALLSDWNAMVLAIGATKHGTAIAHAATLKADAKRLREALEDARGIIFSLASGRGSEYEGTPESAVAFIDNELAQGGNDDQGK